MPVSSKHLPAKGFIPALLYAVLGMTLVSCTPNDKGKVRLNISWEALVHRQDLKWDSIPAGIYDAPFLGNMKVGAVIRKPTEGPASTGRDAMLINFNQSDLNDTCREETGPGYYKRLLLGSLLLKTSSKVRSSNFQLDLWNAELSASMVTDSGKVLLHAFVHSSLPVVILEFSFSGPEAISWSYLPVPRGKAVTLSCPQARPATGCDIVGTVVKSQKQQMVLYRQDLSSGKNYTVGMVAERSLRKIRLFITVITGKGKADMAEEVMNELQRARLVNYASLQGSHRRWWHQYYSHALVSVPDSLVERFYWLQKYKSGCGIPPLSGSDAPLHPEVSADLGEYASATLGYAESGYGNEAMLQLKRYIGGLSGNTLQNISSLANEPPELAMEALQQMMLQYKDSTLMVFHGMPVSWQDAAFHHFLVNREYYVSAVRAHGKTDFVSIMSLRGNSFKFRSDLPADSISMESKLPARVRKIDAYTLSIFIPKSERIILYRKGRKQKFVIKEAGE